MPVKFMLVPLLAIVAVALTATAGYADRSTKAQPNSLKATQSGASCGGVNMLSELAQSDPELFQRVQRDAQGTPNSKAIFWKVTKIGVEPSYIFGTIHITDPRVTDLDHNVVTALEQSQVLALEVADLSPEAMATALLQAVKVALYTDGSNLQKQLSPEEFDKVEDKMKSAGMPVQAARLFRPWVVTMLLATSDCERQRAKTGKLVLDMQLAERARKKNIPVVGLETIDQQLAALSASSNAEQVAMLKVGLAFADRSNDIVETLVQLYLNRELAKAWPFQIALAEKAGQPAEAYEAFYRHLIVDRNQRMHDGVVPLLDKGGAFVAVGSLHLPGSSGLISLLRKSGYDVTPVN